jgi:hypothetical protein
MSRPSHECPDCDSKSDAVSRRDFIKTASAATVALGTSPLWAASAEAAATQPESIVKVLYESLKPGQREKICFDWDYKHPKMGLLRTRVANNWNITEQTVNGGFYTKDQRAMIRSIFEGMVQPQWHAKFDKQLADDCGGFGEDQSIAIFGMPGSDKFEFVLTGRHMTMRCDGNTAEHVAFGGPIFYGHSVTGGDEEANHPENVFWHQALQANKVYDMLDGKQREAAMVAKVPKEQAVAFRGTSGGFPGIPLADCSTDQREEVQKVLKSLVEPYRQSDREEVTACLNAQGGLDKCSLAFYRDGDIGNDKVWDCWRLEGPAFVWYFRGSPHVHVWVNIADSPDVTLNA